MPAGLIADFGSVKEESDSLNRRITIAMLYNE